VANLQNLLKTIEMANDENGLHVANGDEEIEDQVFLIVFI